MDYGRRGDSLFALAFRKKEDTEELYRALCAAWEAGRESGNFEVRGDVGGSAAFGRSPAFEARGGFGGARERGDGHSGGGRGGGGLGGAGRGKAGRGEAS